MSWHKHWVCCSRVCFLRCVALLYLCHLFCFALFSHLFRCQNERQATEVHWISNELKLHPFCTFPLRIFHWVWHCYLCPDSIASFGWKAGESKRMCWESYCSWIFSNAILLLIDFWCKNQIILKTYGMLCSLNSVLCKKSLIQDRFYSKTLCLKNR